VLLITSSADSRASEVPSLELRRGDRVVFIGNTFAERLIRDGYFEAMLASRLPDHQLVFRNLSFSGDEVFRGTLGTGAGPGTLGKFEENTFLQLRSLNFGNIFTHLDQQKADVVFACYGMSESFAGKEALPKFEADLRAFLLRLTELRCGKENTPPRVVLVSPIRREHRRDYDMPDPAPFNANLAAYVESMRKVAGSMRVPFLDLFTPLEPIYAEQGRAPLTINGIHLNHYGNWVVAHLMLRGLGFAASNPISLQAKDGRIIPPEVRLQHLSTVAPPSAATNYHRAILQFLPRVRIEDLAAGKYRLRLNDADAAEGTATQWEKGIPMVLGEKQAQPLLDLVNDKNWHFFMKYRAVNGEYIYGRRKEPFGVVSFPPEFELLERLVAEMDIRIHRLARPPNPIKAELQKID
jgi:hypothetical protein